MSLHELIARLRQRDDNTHINAKTITQGKQLKQKRNSLMNFSIKKKHKKDFIAYNEWSVMTKFHVHKNNRRPINDNVVAVKIDRIG